MASIRALSLRRLFPFAFLGLVTGMVVCYSFPLSLYVCFSFSAMRKPLYGWLGWAVCIKGLRLCVYLFGRKGVER